MRGQVMPTEQPPPVHGACPAPAAPHMARSKPAASGADAEMAVALELPRCDGVPCAVVWTAIPPITWLLPFVGHMGICDSAGLLHDWGGGPVRPCPPTEMLFGRPCRYILFHPRDPAAWDAALAQADREYADKDLSLIHI